MEKKFKPNKSLGYENRRQLWLKELDRWCENHHHLTREQALSLLSCFDFKELLWAEYHEFVDDTIAELETE
jgi:hypothetical protein